MEQGLPELATLASDHGLTVTSGAWLLASPGLPELTQRLAELALGARPQQRAHVVGWLDGQARTYNPAPAPGLDAVVDAAIARPGEAQRSADGWSAVLLCSPQRLAEGSGLVLIERTDRAAALAQWAQSLREHVDAALDLLRLRSEVTRLRQREKLQRALFAIADVAGSQQDMSAMLRTLHGIVAELIYADNCYIALYDEARDSIRFLYFVDTNDQRWQEPDAVESMESIRNSLTWYLIRDAKPLRGPSERLHEQVSGPLQVIGPHSADWLGVPMLQDGRVRGACVVQSYREGNRYTQTDQALLAFVGGHILTALDRKQAQADLAQRTRELSEQIAQRQEVQRQLEHEVLHDPLTGLPNRAYLREQVVRALARAQREPDYRFAVLVMDLDRFKVVNDSAGHPVGDALLVEVAHRFGQCMRAPDMLARLGGDEFAILLEHVDSSEGAVRLAQRLVASLDAPLHAAGKELFTSVSLGIVLSHRRYQDADEMLRDAEIAMYRAKGNDRQRFELFDELQHEQALELLDLESALRRAIVQREFEPYFQPIVRLDDGEVVGYEALLRWNRPQRGVLLPGAFLRVAEVSGLLENIDWLMFEHTCALIPQLVQGHQYVNINFSPRHFRNDHVDERLLTLLRSHGVTPAQVRIEVTEGTLMDNPERVGQTIDRLHQAGVYTALDDFGTGYSSLGYLHRFRLHTVKIDRSFVSDLMPGVTSPASAVAEAILTLSRSLGLEVVAEGIETQAQCEALKVLGCRLGQGYLFARPQPAQVIMREERRIAGAW